MQPWFSHDDDVLEALRSACSAYIDLILGLVVDSPPHHPVAMSGHRLLPHTVRSIVEHIAAGDNNTKVSRATGVTRDAIRKMRLSLDYWGTPYAPRTVRLGRLRSLAEDSRCRNTFFCSYFVPRKGWVGVVVMH
jgi:hypothetical protein